MFLEVGGEGLKFRAGHVAFVGGGKLPHRLNQRPQQGRWKMNLHSRQFSAAAVSAPITDRWVQLTTSNVARRFTTRNRNACAGVVRKASARPSLKQPVQYQGATTLPVLAR